jgi:hypothetical protein
MYGRITGGAKAVPLVLLTPVNESVYCLGRLGRDRVCLMKQDYCDVAKHEKQKLLVTDNVIHIMAQATKNSKFAAYADPAVNAALLTEDQYAARVFWWMGRQSRSFSVTTETRLKENPKVHHLHCTTSP